MLDQVSVSLVGVLCGPETGVHLERPQLLAIPAREEAAGPWWFTGEPKVYVVPPSTFVEIGRGVDRLHLEAARGDERLAPLM